MLTTYAVAEQAFERFKKCEFIPGATKIEFAALLNAIKVLEFNETTRSTLYQQYQTAIQTRLQQEESFTPVLFLMATFINGASGALLGVGVSMVLATAFSNPAGLGLVMIGSFMAAAAAFFAVGYLIFSEVKTGRQDVSALKSVVATVNRYRAQQKPLAFPPIHLQNLLPVSFLDRLFGCSDQHKSEDRECRTCFLPK